MVYNYLLDLYQVLDERKKHIELQIGRLSDAGEKLRYQRGRLQAIDDFKGFLTSHYHAKLPRRLRTQL